MDQTDIQAVEITSGGIGFTGTTAAVTHPTRLKALWIRPSITTAAQIDFYDGTSATAGNLLFSMVMGVAGGNQAPSCRFISIPNNGIRFRTSINVKITNTSGFGMTVFYG